MMTGRERIGRILERKPADRIGLYEHFCGDTHRVWTEQGHIRADEDLGDHFGFDLALCWPFNTTGDLDYVPEVVEETEETILTRDGNGALLRRHKLHDSTPEHGVRHVVHSDHSIPCTVDYGTYRYFVDKALELGRY